MLSFPRLGEALLEGSGEDPDLSGRLRKFYDPRVDKYDLAGASKLIDIETAKHLALVGNADDCQARLEDYYEAGLSLPVLVPVNDEISFEVLNAFSKRTQRE